jgi:hypothetical protein
MPKGLVVAFLVIVAVFIFIRLRKRPDTDNYDGYGGRRGGGGRGFRRPYIPRPIIYGNPYVYPSAILTLDNEDEDPKDLEIKRLKEKLKKNNGS